MNWTNILKKGLITILILVIGLVMFFACGFNKGYDFTGGSVVTVRITPYVDADNTRTEQDAKDIIKDVLNSYNNISVYSINNGMNGSGDKTVIVKYQISGDVANTNINIQNDLFENLEYDKTNLVEVNYINMATDIQPAYDNGIFIYGLFGSLMALLACAVYIWLRHGLTNAICVVLGVIIDVLALLALTIMLRLQITAHMGYAILATTIISIIFNMIMLGKLRENSFKEAYKKSSNVDISNQTRKSLLKPYIIALGSILVALLIVAIVAYGNVGGAVYAVAVSLISVFMTSLFIVPGLWELVYIKKERRPKQKEVVEIEHE